MNIKPAATVVWAGSGNNGTGNISTRSGALQSASYSFNSRFKGMAGTSPEELIAAAHAGCFTMKLAFNLEEAGFTADKLETSCSVVFSDGRITTSMLHVEATIPGIAEDKFKELVDNAEKNCPVSQALNVKIVTESKLNG